MSDLTDGQLIEQYVADMKFRELSEETIKVRKSYLTKAAKDIGFRADDVRELRQRYQRWLMRPSIQAGGTRSVWITTLHCAYQFWNREGYFQRVAARNGALVDFDPTDGIPKPKTKKGTPHPITDESLQRALDNSDRLMRCWLLIGALCGARCIEIANIYREDVHETDPEPWLHLRRCKGGKVRDVPLHDEAAAALHDLPMAESGRLWDRTNAQVSREINDHLHSLDCVRTDQEPATAHALRHFAGTAWYRASLDLQLVADLLGHANTQITSVYAASDHSKAAALVNGIRIGKMAA